MAKSPDNQRPAKATGKPPRRAKAARPNVRFEATLNNDHIDLRATAPAKWFRVLLRVLIILVIVTLILKAPEVLQAIQAAIHLLPK